MSRWGEFSIHVAHGLEWPQVDILTGLAATADPGWVVCFGLDEGCWWVDEVVEDSTDQPWLILTEQTPDYERGETASIPVWEITELFVP